jgi:putative SOS response-associated peptidase YedK
VCYRYSLIQPPRHLYDLFGVEFPADLQPRNNIALTTPVASVRLDATGDREVAMLRFGLIPRWSKEAKPAGFGNARSETVAEKPAFRDALKKRRCLVPADGFYEWEHIGGEKLPWQFSMADGKTFAFAGIWESWTNPAGVSVESLAILTTVPNRLVSPFHDRMPVILANDAYDRWLLSNDASTLMDLFAPFNPDLMTKSRVEDNRFRHGRV